jgi:hypothetical protein
MRPSGRDDRWGRPLASTAGMCMRTSAIGTGGGPEGISCCRPPVEKRATHSALRTSAGFICSVAGRRPSTIVIARPSPRASVGDRARGSARIQQGESVSCSIAIHTNQVCTYTEIIVDVCQIDKSRGRQGTPASGHHSEGARGASSLGPCHRDQHRLRCFDSPPIIKSIIRHIVIVMGVRPVRERPARPYSNSSLEAIMTTQGAMAARIHSLHILRSTGRVCAYLPPVFAEPPTCA